MMVGGEEEVEQRRRRSRWKLLRLVATGLLFDFSYDVTPPELALHVPAAHQPPHTTEIATSKLGTSLQ